MSETQVMDVAESQRLRQHPHRTDARGARAFIVRAVREPWPYLTVFVVLGATLRWIGLSWGLPLQLHPDEWVVVRGAIDMAARNSFEPGYFFRPDHLEIQLSYLAYQAYAHLLHGSSPEVVFASNEAPFFLISRFITSLFGIAMIPLAYLVGRRFGRKAALISAGLVAIFPPFVSNSHYATPDIPLTFICMLVIYTCMRYLESPGWLWLVASCAGVALGVTVKYPAALAGIMVAIVVIVVAVRTANWRSGVAHFVASPFIFLISAFVFSPVLFTNIAAVKKQLIGQNSTGGLGADGLGPGGNLGFYAADFTMRAGYLIAALAIVGIWICVWRKSLAAVPLVLGGIMWVAISQLTLHWSRWGLPFYAVFLIFAAVGGAWLFDASRRWVVQRKVMLRWVLPLATVWACVAAANLVVSSTVAVVRQTIPDTRQASREYFDEFGITSKNTIYEGYSTLLPGAPQLFFEHFKSENDFIRVDPEMRRASKFRYALVSDGMASRFKAESRYSQEQRVYRLINEQFSVRAQWKSTANAPTPTGWEFSDVIQQASDLRTMLSPGAMSGPGLTLYDIPASHR